MTNSEKEELFSQNQPEPRIRSYRAGEILFKEGSEGDELFVIQEGKVGVYQESSEGRVELAAIEKGGIIGEMSMLDNLPRSATVKALEDTRVMVVNRAVFKEIMKNVPAWLHGIIKIVVSRLRDANKRVDQAVLRDRERGLVNLMLLLLPVYKRKSELRQVLDYELVTVESFFVCRIRKKETVRILEKLQARGIIQILSGSNSSPESILINDIDVMHLYDEFLLLRSQRRKFKELLIPEGEIAMLNNIAYIAQKSGKELRDSILLMKSALVEDFSDKNSEKIETRLLDLRRRGLINLEPSGGDTAILFQKEILTRIKKIQDWLPRFEMELK